MPQIGKILLMLVFIAVVIIVGFNLHWLIGAGVIVALLGYAIYMNRSAVHAVKANAAYARGDQDEALALFEKACQWRNPKPQYVLSYAYLLMKSGKPKQAEAILEEQLRTVRNEDVRMMTKSNLATAYWLLGKQDESIAMLEEVYKDYKTVMVTGNLGYFKILHGDLEAALAFNEEAYQYDDNDLTIVDNLAQNYYLLGRLEEAAELYEKVMEKSPKYAESYYYYARTLVELGRDDEASKYARLALEKPQALVTNVSRKEMEQFAEMK